MNSSNDAPKALRMGTRGSPLALAQARQVARQLEALHPHLQVLETIIRTTGDKQQGQPLPQIGGKGVFTLEIEAALSNGEIDFAVHSLKDLPPYFPAGLCLACVPTRENPNDALIVRRDLLIEFASLDALPGNAKIGTSSLRRQAQMLALRPDLHIESVRGNIDTRLRKLDESFDAIILARAGLNRLNVDLNTRTHFDLPCEQFVPAPGQGALALEARCDDQSTLQVLASLEDTDSRRCIEAERSCMEMLEAGCSTPLGAHATIENKRFTLQSVMLSPDGTRRIEATQTVSVETSSRELGERVAQQLIERGARELMA